MRRDWSAAQPKRDQGCRVSQDCEGPVELAHIIGRIRDERRDGKAVVNPDSIVPLCRHHHAMYDAHRLDVLPYLTAQEQAQAVLDAGSLESARRRMVGYVSQ